MNEHPDRAVLAARLRSDRFTSINGTYGHAERDASHLLSADAAMYRAKTQNR
jgi:GGDEF domain-containing protein